MNRQKTASDRSGLIREDSKARTVALAHLLHRLLDHTTAVPDIVLIIETVVIHGNGVMLVTELNA